LFDAFGEDGGPSAAAPAEALPEVAEWPEAEKLKYEKEVLDFYFSSHPLAQHERELRARVTHTVAQLKQAPAGEEVVLGGLLVQVRYGTVKKARNGNTRMLRCKVEDLTGAVESLMWPDDLVRCKDAVAEDQICVVKGTVEHKAEPSLVLTRVLTLEQAVQEMAKALWLRLRLERHGP